jgi:hypothetical protein
LIRSLGGLTTIREKTVSFHIERDTEKRGVWPTVRRAWKRGIYSDSTHHVVLQDDALASKNFLETARTLCALKPDDLICYFSIRKAATDCQAAGKHWFTTNEGAFGISLCFPKPFLRGLLEWEKKNVDPACPHDDTRVANYLRWGPGKGKKVWHPCPSLIEHAAPADSVLGHNNSNRVAKVWVGTRDPLTIDWAKDAEDPHVGGGSSMGDKKWLKTS